MNPRIKARNVGSTKIGQYLFIAFAIFFPFFFAAVPYFHSYIFSKKGG